MVVKPIIKNNICLNAHPAGLAAMVRNEIVRVTREPKISGIKNALVIGASTGYGLASRIVAAFGAGAATIGVASGRPPTVKRTGNVGYYTTRAFETAAAKAGLYAKSFTGDAFSNEMKERIVGLLKKENRRIDLFVYSLASGARTDPVSGLTYRGVIKPIGQSFQALSVDVAGAEVKSVTLPPATDPEIESAVKVMGGEDWKLWIGALLEHHLFTPGFRTIAYSYIGPALTAPVYRDGTLGRAKKHLEATAREMNKALAPLGGHAVVSVNKAIVTRSSAVIPLVPLYMSFLYRVMREKNLHEGALEQIERLFRKKYPAGALTETDEEGRIRLDDLELRSDVQEEVSDLYLSCLEKGARCVAEITEFREEFLRFHGFSWPAIDYDEDVDIS